MKELFRRDLNLIWWANIALMVCYTASGALLPLMMHARGIGEGWTGFAMGMVSAGSVVGYLTGAQFVDRWDRRRLILAGGLLWAISSLLAWAASSVLALALVRLAQGFAYSILYTAALVYAAQALNPHLRGRMVGLVEAIGALAIAATPAPVYWLAQHWGYGPVLVVAAGVGLLAGAPGLFLTPQAAGDRTERPALQRQESGRRWVEPRAFLPGLVGVSLFSCATAFVTLSPLVALRLGIGEVGAFLGLRALGTVPARLFSGWLSDRFGPNGAIVSGFLLSILAFALLAASRSSLAGLGLAFLFGIGMGLVSPALSAWVLRSVPPERQGVALTTLYLFAEGSGFLGAWAFGLGLERAGVSLSLAGLCLVLLAGLGIYFITVGGRSVLRRANRSSQI